MAVSSWIAQESAGMLPELLPASPPAAICWAGALPCSEHPQIPEPSSFQTANEPRDSGNRIISGQSQGKHCKSLYFLHPSPGLAAVLKGLSRLGIHSTLQGKNLQPIPMTGG